MNLWTSLKVIGFCFWHQWSVEFRLNRASDWHMFSFITHESVALVVYHNIIARILVGNDIKFLWNRA